MMRKAGSLAILVLVGAAAQAQAPVQASTPPIVVEGQAPPKPVKVKKVCRDTPVIGSRIPRSTCRTADEWAVSDRAAEAQAKELVDRIHNGAAYTAAPGQDAASQMGLSPR